MKSVISFVLCGAAASSLVREQNPPAPAADHKIEILEKDIVTTRRHVDELDAQLAETRAELDAVLKYVGEQAASAKNMAKTLDESEQAGFTFGINPDSRHILLRGWRESLAAVQKDLPGAPAPSAKPAPKSAGDAKAPGGN
jgi:hypothetical protein